MNAGLRNAVLDVPNERLTDLRRRITATVWPERETVFAVTVLLFGGSQLPKLARSLGRAKTEFHHGLAGKDATADKTSSQVDTPKPTVPQKPSTN